MNYIISKETKDPNYKCGAPFHGDRIFIDIIYDLLKNSEYFIETGTAYGDTLKFIVDNFPQIKSISCEPDEYRYKIVTEFIKNGCDILKVTSPEIFEIIKQKYSDSFEKQTLFWLDAHGEYNGKTFWPLREEITFIKNNFKNYYILIDDFKNPYNEKFSYDVVGGISCGLDYIKDLLENDKIYFPNYSELQNDSWHSLTGWVLITKNEFTNSKIIEHR